MLLISLLCTQLHILSWHHIVKFIFYFVQSLKLVLFDLLILQVDCSEKTLLLEGFIKLKLGQTEAAEVI